MYDFREQEIKTRAITAVHLEERELEAKRTAYQTALSDGSSASKLAVLKTDLDAATTASAMSEYEMLRLNLLQTKTPIETDIAQLTKYISQRRSALEALRGDGKNLEFAQAQRTGFIPVGGTTEFRPRVSLASEETGQVSDILCMLEQISPEGVTPGAVAAGRHHHRLHA